jgi:diaminopimelate epimerase
MKVTLPGGDLVIDWRDADDHILMTGPFALDYQGTIPPELLQPAPATSG